MSENNQYDLIVKAINRRGTKFIRNASLCGTGKTTTTLEVIQASLEHGLNERWIIAMPTHDLCSEFATKYHGEHLWGKEHFCTHGNQFRFGCPKECKNTCRYYAQAWNAPLVFCPYELIDKCSKDIPLRPTRNSPHVNLVIEECPDRIIIPTFHLSDRLKSRITLGTEVSIKDHNHTWTYQQVVGALKGEEIEDQELYMFLNGVENAITDGEIIYAHRNLYTQRFHRVIFNCATTPESFQALFFPSRYTLINVSERISNPMLYFKGKYTKMAAEKFFPSIQAFKAKIEEEKSVFLASKMAFVGSESAHYGGNRGENRWNQAWDLAIIYGDFHYPPQFKHALSLLLGFDCEKMCQDLERAEVEQTMHRVRPVLHPTTPILIFANRVMLNGEHITLSNKSAITNYVAATEPDDWYNKLSYQILTNFLDNCVFKTAPTPIQVEEDEWMHYYHEEEDE